MTKLQAIRKTIDKWGRFRFKHRAGYWFDERSCALCQYDWERGGGCFDCPWEENYGDCAPVRRTEFNWLYLLLGSKTEAAFDDVRIAVIGMLMYLEDKYSG